MALVVVPGGSNDTTTQAESEIARILGAQSYYDVLNLPVDASESDIIRSYRKLVVRVHPDKNTAEGANEAFLKVQAAFLCLSNERNRQIYDHHGESAIDDFELDEKKLRQTVRESLQMLSLLGIRLPPEEQYEDFANFVTELYQSGRFQALYQRYLDGAFIAVLATGMTMPISFPLFLVVIALGPQVIGPALFWEQILAEYEGTSLGGRLTSSQAFSTLASLTSSSVRIFLVWSVTIACVTVSVPIFLVKYVAGLVRSMPTEQLDEWILADVAEDGTATFQEEHAQQQEEEASKNNDGVNVEFTDVEDLSESVSDEQTKAAKAWLWVHVQESEKKEKAL